MYSFRFTDKDVQKHYNEKGYAVLPLLADNEIKELLMLYKNVNASIFGLSIYERVSILR